MSNRTSRRVQRRKKKILWMKRAGILCMMLVVWYLGMYMGRQQAAKKYEQEKKELLEEIKKQESVDKTVGQEEDTPSISTGLQNNTWSLQLVNSTHAMEEDYVPELVEIENGYQVDERIADALNEMLAACRKEGLNPWICSAYRSVKRQQTIYNNSVKKYKKQGYSEAKAKAKTEESIAVPGTSEHGLGLAVDIVSKKYQILDKKQETTKEAKWLKENCYKYGFIVRYPEGKEKITGIIYEPWHYRYVGVEAAEEIMKNGLCLEEYLEQTD